MGQNGAADSALGLRERKKLITRNAIQETAQTMFAERGYDSVTVAQIAEAVNLSANTVFGYFPAKEDLVLGRAIEVREMMVDRIRNRPVGHTPLRAMVAAIRELLAAWEAEPDDGHERMLRIIDGSLTLRSRMPVLWDRFEQALAEALAEEAGEGPQAPRPSVVAAQLTLIFRMMASERFQRYVRSHAEPAQRDALEEWLAVIVELVGGGIADYAPRLGGSHAMPPVTT